MRYLLKTILFTNTAKNKMASVQKETSSSITLKGSTEIVADFFGNEHINHWFQTVQEKSP